MRGLQRELRKSRALSPKERQELYRLEKEVDDFTRNYVLGQQHNQKENL